MAASGEVHLTNVRDMQYIGVMIVKTLDIAGPLQNQYGSIKKF
ncbi:MAG: hypothetical protein WCF90_04555 [Methanomicrobiales archaeon]